MDHRCGTFPSASSGQCHPFNFDQPDVQFKVDRNLCPGFLGKKSNMLGRVHPEYFTRTALVALVTLW
jgi:hypothetical protein